MSLLITLRRGRKTKTVCCNPRGRDSGLDTTQTELKLFIDNDGDLYRRQTAPIQKNLTKKFVKGTYNHKLAVKLWKYLADNGAKKYAKDFSLASDWNTIFTVSDRAAVAQALADDWLAELKAGNRHNPLRRGSSRSTVSANISKLIHEGYPQKQAIAISMRSAGKSRRNPRVAKTKLVYVVQGNYGYGWDDENEEDNWTDAKRSIREYRENGPGSYRLIKRRVPIASNPRKSSYASVNKKIKKVIKQIAKLPKHATAVRRLLYRRYDALLKQAEKFPEHWDVGPYN